MPYSGIFFWQFSFRALGTALLNPNLDLNNEQAIVNKIDFTGAYHGTFAYQTMMRLKEKDAVFWKSRAALMAPEKPNVIPFNLFFCF